MKVKRPKHCGKYMRLTGKSWTWRNWGHWPIGIVRTRFCSVCGKIRRQHVKVPSD